MFSEPLYEIFHAELMSVSHLENLYGRVVEFGLKFKSKFSSKCWAYLFFLLNENVSVCVSQCFVLTIIF